MPETSGSSSKDNPVVAKADVDTGRGRLKVTVTVEVDVPGLRVEEEQGAVPFPDETAAVATPTSPQAVEGQAGPATATTATVSSQTATAAKPDNEPVVALGGGRKLPPLLFVTNQQRLSDAIGLAEATFVMNLVHDAGQRLLLVNGDDAEQLAAIVHQQIKPETRGVVLIGGYGVVPAFRVDTLPVDAAEKGVRRRLDPDEFIVWSDDRYVDVDGDGLPELPISRVPDARSHLVTVQALCGGTLSEVAGSGIRNTARPFAEAVAKRAAEQFPLAISHPTDSSTFEAKLIGGPLTYLMLHGSDIDGTRMWGEDEAGRLVETVTVSDLPETVQGTFFSGACWGALIVSQIARRATPGTAIADRVEAQSIALSILSRGADAFVGATGAHYSPRGNIPDRAAGPLHLAFFEAIKEGDSSALATWKAKQAYLAHVATLTDAAQLAIATKVLNEFTCLGLGW
ncbi:MAG TPA: hypothetical protein VGR26_11300 [Acidimicrobiales bacterium]|nr:hypothetical protein [Acidimicrobiales bacterium]